MQGVGILIDPQLGRRFEGEFDDDESCGLGRLIFENGDIYVGEVQKMMRVGLGRHTCKKTGAVYEG
jgi:hypothetical protein